MEIIIQSSVLLFIQYLLILYSDLNVSHMLRGIFHHVSGESII